MALSHPTASTLHNLEGRKHKTEKEASSNELNKDSHWITQNAKTIKRKRVHRKRFFYIGKNKKGLVQEKIVDK